MKPFDSLGDRSGTGTDPAETTTLGGLIVVDDGTGNSGIGLGVCGFVGRIGGLGECTPDTIAAAGIMPGTVLGPSGLSDEGQQTPGTNKLLKHNDCLSLVRSSRS